MEKAICCIWNHLKISDAKFNSELPTLVGLELACLQQLTESSLIQDYWAGRALNSLWVVIVLSSPDAFLETGPDISLSNISLYFQLCEIFK